MNLIELQRTGKIEVIEQQGERWNLDDLLALPEAHEEDGMAHDDAAEYRLYDSEGREIRLEELEADPLRSVYAVPTYEETTGPWEHVGTARTIEEARKLVEAAGYTVLWEGGLHEVSPRELSGDQANPLTVTVVASE